MTDASTFGGGTAMDGAQDTGGFGSALSLAPSIAVPVTPMPIAPPDSEPTRPEQSFGASLRRILPGPQYTPPDPQATALDQTADTLQQRIQRANSIATNPVLSAFDPAGVQKARDFIPQATEQLQKIRAQKANMQANQVQAATLGLAPGEVPDEASQADRVAVAQGKALKGDLKVFKGLQAVDPKAAEAIQDQVHEAVAGHLTKAQLAFDSLSAMTNQGQYQAKLDQLRSDGTLSDLEALGLKVPKGYDEFSASKAREGQALREARIGVDTIRQKLEDRNTYQPMEEKEAKTYAGRLTTAYGDQITNGQWGHNGASGTRGLVVNGAADPRDLGKSFTLATPEQRKAIKEEFDGAVPKEDVEKYRAFNRTYQLATTDAKGNKVADHDINTNPNVQQGVAEGLASMLRGGQGGANVGLLKIELAKRGWAQGAIDGLIGNYAGAINTMFANADKPYLSKATRGQIRDVMDVLKTYNDQNIGDRATQIAQRAGALGLDPASLGFGQKETAGGVGDALEQGRQAQIARMMPNHQAIGGGDGVLQLGAQRPGSGATGSPPGTVPANQLPGAQPLATPVQQAQNPPQPAAPGPVPTGGTPPGPPPSQQVQASPGGQPPAPVTIAGQPVTFTPPPGASPNFVPALQRIESGNEKNPWTAGTANSSASGAFQFINKTWADNKPAGAPARAADATPAQQTAALETLTAKNATSLQSKGLPVNDTNLYVAHNLGAEGGSKLLQADPNADARTVVGETAAKNNPRFFRGRPTVAAVLSRYQVAMASEATDDTGPKPKLGAGGATAEAPGLLSRLNSMLMQGVPQDQRAAAAADVGNAATENAPAIGSTVGAVSGSLLGPAGTVGGGAAGGTAGQALKDYLQGNAQSPTKLAEQGALGGVLGVGGAARPVLSAAARTVGASAVEAGTKAVEGGDAADIADAGLKGAGEGALGETFGRALGMVGHKVWSMFAPDAKKAVQTAAKSYSDAIETLKTTEPKLGTGPNPAYEAAEAAKDKAETVLKDAGLKPEEAAYAHKVSADAVPKQEAEVSRPGALEKDQIGAGYQQLEGEVGATGRGAPKATLKLADGPLSAVEAGKVSKTHAELAQHTEMAITAPAANWQEKWNQLKDARSALLQAERDAQSSTAPGKTKIANDMRTLADTVRVQQAKAAKYVFGEKDGEAFMGRLKVLDTRYRNLMDATNNGDLVQAARMTGEAGRAADQKFRAFAHDDPAALQAWAAMRGAKNNVEKDVLQVISAEKIPLIGKAISLAKLAGGFKEWMRERTAGSPAKFADFINQPRDETGKLVRDVTGTIAQRGAVQGNVLGQ